MLVKYAGKVYMFSNSFVCVPLNISSVAVQEWEQFQLCILLKKKKNTFFALKYLVLACFFSITKSVSSRESVAKTLPILI